MEFDFGHTILPNYDVPEGFETHYDYIEKITKDGLVKHYGQEGQTYEDLTEEIKTRTEYELGVIKKMGYVFEEISPNRWGKTMFCAVCNKNRSHYKLISTEPLVDKKPRCSISPKQRKRVLGLLDERDAFTGASITSTPEIDHKVPWSRLEQDINIAQLTDEQIQEHFQLLTREHNLLKDRTCQHCIKTQKRPPLFGISFWYEGNDIYQCMPAQIADCYVKVDKFKWFDIYISEVRVFP